MTKVIEMDWPDFSDPNDPHCYRQHFGFGLMYALLAPLVLLYFTTPIAAITTTVVTGQALIFGKELLDTRCGSGWSWADILSGELGFLPPIIVLSYLFFGGTGV